EGVWRAGAAGRVLRVPALGLRRERLFAGGSELVGHGAAQTAIGELDDILLGAGRVPAAFQDLAVDADIAELVDDNGKPSPIGIGENVSDQRGLARTEKAGDDGAGDAGKRDHSSSSTKSSGGTRAIRPRFRTWGRPRRGLMASPAPASRRAPSMSAGAPLSASSPPNTYVPV